MRFLRGRQALQGVYIIDINAMVFGMPRALFPAMAGSVFGGGTITLGFLYAAPGVGALIGALTTGWVAHLKRQGWGVILAVVAWGAAIAVFGLVDTLWVGLLMLAIAGWADVISAVLRNTILQTSIPDRFRSRMSSIQMAVVQGGPRSATWSRAPSPRPPASSSRWSPVGWPVSPGRSSSDCSCRRFRDHLAVPEKIDDVAV